MGVSVITTNSRFLTASTSLQSAHGSAEGAESRLGPVPATSHALCQHPGRARSLASRAPFPVQFLQRSHTRIISLKRHNHLLLALLEAL